MLIFIKKLHEDAVIPKYQTEGASGFDLHALEDVDILPGEIKIVKTGLAIDVGLGYELQVRPRSGLSLRTHIRIANSPGTVDADYRGEICIIMENTEDTKYAKQYCPGDTDSYVPFEIKKGDRIAQGVVCPVIRADIQVVDTLIETKRDANGFGSTGK